MDNAAPAKPKGIRSSRPKPRVMQAALLMWTDYIYHAADAAVRAGGGYVHYSEGSEPFRRYADVMKDLKALAAKLDRLAGRVAPQPGVRGGCEDDQDCPDDQICVHGTCEPLFPEG
jgi:hypothetical protein